ncbi:MAG: DUF4147 domain-containing protein [Acidobacteriaceae bacterium]
MNWISTQTDAARLIFERALAHCSIERATDLHVFTENNHLYIGERAPDAAVDLTTLQSIRIIAAGKAARTMLLAILPHLPPCEITGILIAPKPPTQLPGGFQYFSGGHPLPNEQSFAGARAALGLAHAAAQEAARTLCIFLISGGASAMMELPLDRNISVDDTAAFHRVLVASGAPIADMNCVRKHFSAVKGGRLALAAGDAPCRSLLVSDVPAGRRDALASGPTVPDSTTVQQCREILEQHRLLPQFPLSVRNFFEASTLPETPKATELTARTCVLLDSENLANAAKDNAEALGYTAVIDNTCDEWDYREAAQYLLDRFRSLRREYGRICLISAGEVNVELPVDPGTGGRNQQFALYCATLLRPTDGAVAILSAGSDGIDGNSPAAGAVVEMDIAADPEASQALVDFNTHPFLRARNATITTGPSGNNLRDLRLLLG